MLTLGIDEVGRGCWAGPLVVGAVVLDKLVSGLKDSKDLTANQRQKLAEKIKTKAKATSLGWVEAKEVDSLGLTAATTLAIKRALNQINCGYDEIVIDGSINYLPDNSKSRALVKADAKVPSVSAASIIAKVARDEYMIEISKNYRGYGFDKHVGYGTKLHLEKLRQLGITDLHRQSFKPIKLLS